VELTGDIDIQVHQEDEATRHLVIPRKPSSLTQPIPRTLSSGWAGDFRSTCPDDATECTRRVCFEGV
jgi:hypothetical protein